jgi:hypothetical protein
VTAARRSRWPLTLTGAVVGLTWAAALRGWMVQMAGHQSAFHWYPTFLLVLLPGTLVGAAFGLAEHRRRTGLARSRWLVLAPLLFASALLDPTIFRQFITQGIGGGSVGVALAGLAGGYALSGRGSAWWRRTCGTLATLIVLMMLVMASDQEPLGQPRGTWVGLYAASLVALLCVASAIPQRVERAALVPAAWHAVAVGALAGLAWAAALRGFMTAVAGADSAVTWSGTFVWVLAPGVVIGALLAWGEWRRWSGEVPYRRWLVWSPMVFTAVLVHDPLHLVSGFDGGVGLSAVAVPALCMIGGYGIAGRGPAAVRALCVLVALSAVPVWALTAESVGGRSSRLGDPHGAWAAVLYWGLLATFSMAASIPHRRAESSPGPSDPVREPTPDALARKRSGSSGSRDGRGRVGAGSAVQEVPATATQLPAGSVECPTTRPLQEVDGPPRRTPTSRTGSRRSSSTSGTHR